MIRLPIFATLFAAMLSVSVGPSASAADGNWPRWRGPNQDGHTSEKGLPTKWSDADVQWKRPLKGEGQSSPVVWGERIFLTQSHDKGAKRLLLCINRNDGRVIWEKVCWTGTPERSHRMNGWASATPATDGKYVYAFFGHGGGLFCYTANGSLVWNQKLGEHYVADGWGTAASPVIVGDLVIQNCDADRNAFIVGLDKKTGKEVWRTKRDNNRGWSTPILVKTDKRNELVVNGDTGVRAYDPKTGKELWFCKSFNGRGTPTVTPSDAGLLHVVNGKPGDTYAVKPGGSGDVTSTHMEWHSRRIGGRDLSSPIVIGKYMLVVSMRGGVLTAYDTKSGKLLWSARIGTGRRQQFSATPISYDGLAVFIAENGEAVLVKPGPKLNIVARNRLSAGKGEIFRSSITPSDGQLFVRSTGALYCVGKRKSAAK